jgi:transcriptional regulator with XRE-family HTH domain
VTGLDLAVLRELAGLSQLGLARFSGIPLEMIRALESTTGPRPRLSDEDIDRLAEALVLSDAGTRVLRAALERPRPTVARRGGAPARGLRMRPTTRTTRRAGRS